MKSAVALKEIVSRTKIYHTRKQEQNIIEREVKEKENGEKISRK